MSVANCSTIEVVRADADDESAIDNRVRPRPGANASGATGC
jgi:hypothetical protein